MSRLDELIAELCPDGVEYKELQDVLTIKNGSDYKGFGEGDIPVYGSGGIMAYVDRFAYDKPSVLIPRKGSIDKLYYVDNPFWNVDTIFYTIIDTEKALPRYVYHWLLREHLEKLNTAGGVPSLTQKVLNRVKIAVPPLEVQREIVRVLDNFTFLSAELSAELSARRKQYEYYRNQMLTFKTSVRTFRIQEICEISRGKVISKEDIKDNPGIYPVYSSQTENNGELGRISSFMYDGEYLTWTTDGANAGTVFYRTGKFNITNVCGLLKVNTQIANTRYLFHALSIEAPKHVSRGMGNPKLMSNVMGSIKISIPEIGIQNRIANILDNFDAICTDLNIGLPAEIEARQKQYEYYRDKLLTFNARE